MSQLMQAGTSAHLAVTSTAPGSGFLQRFTARYYPWIAWWICALLMLATAGLPSVRRTQEARVLETARPMVDGSFQQWMIPRLNENLRLQKPPLAYWMVACSYAVFGVSAWAARLPFALCGLLTSALLLHWGTRWFSRRAGFFAMAGTLGCLTFIRYGQAAETDVLTLLFVAIAIYAITQAMQAGNNRHIVGWCHISTAAIALTILSKGMPGIYPALFLFVLAIVTHRWDLVRRWFTCGAPITLLLIALPWFIYITATVGYQTFAYEVSVVVAGGGHRGSFTRYFAYLPVALLPWTGVALLGLYLACVRCRRDQRLLALVLWFAVIFIPLCLAGQKQRHYLLPAIPPLMMIMGWYLDRILRATWRPTLNRVADLYFWVVLGGVFLAGLSIPFFTYFAGRVLNLEDPLMIFTLVAGTSILAAFRIHAGLPRAMIALAALTPMVGIVASNAWQTSFDNTSPHVIADGIEAVAGRDTPIKLIGGGNLPLQFYLGTNTEEIESYDQWYAATNDNRKTLLIQCISDDEPMPHLNSASIVMSFRDEEETYYVFARD